MDVCLLWVLNVLSGRGLCDELITRPEDSFRLWRVVVCDLETWWMGRPWPTGGLLRVKQTKHVSLTLVDLPLYAQNSYLFTCNTFIKILYMFRALPCSSSGGLRRNCIYVASGIVTLCRWLSCAPVKKELFLNRCTRQSPADIDDTRGYIYTITT